MFAIGLDTFQGKKSDPKPFQFPYGEKHLWPVQSTKCCDKMSHNTPQRTMLAFVFCSATHFKWHPNASPERSFITAQSTTAQDVHCYTKQMQQYIFFLCALKCILNGLPNGVQCNALFPGINRFLMFMIRNCHLCILYNKLVVVYCQL